MPSFGTLSGYAKKFLGSGICSFLFLVCDLAAKPLKECEELFAGVEHCISDIVVEEFRQVSDSYAGL